MVAKKKVSSRKSAAKPKANKTPAAAPSLKAITAKQTKVQIVTAIADETGVAKRDVQTVFKCLSETARRHLMKRGSGEFSIPELGVKLRRVTRPATKARQGRNPLTGETITIKAKPARQAIKATALKSLKELLTA
jgi:nucleoid DNA-binding protein